jgi:hypothetical protein
MNCFGQKKLKGEPKNDLVTLPYGNIDFFFS